MNTQTRKVAKTVWYKNVTLWMNAITVGVLVLTTYFGVAVPVELQTAIIAIVNLILQAPTMASTKKRAMTHNRAMQAEKNGII